MKSIEVRFSEGDRVHVDGFMGLKVDGEVIRKCFVSEGTCLVLYDGAQRGMWTPVEFVKAREAVKL